MTDLVVEERKITVDEYMALRNSTKWQAVTNEQAGKALQNDLFSVCVSQNESIVGIGRMIGDGAIYFYIQDIIIAPELQNKGIGRLIMNSIDQYLNRNAPKGAFIGLMAAEGTHAFYQNFGFKIRPNDRPGMYKIMKQ